MILFPIEPQSENDCGKGIGIRYESEDEAILLIRLSHQLQNATAHVWTVNHPEGRPKMSINLILSKKSPKCSKEKWDAYFRKKKESKMKSITISLIAFGLSVLIFISAAIWYSIKK